MSVIGDIIDDLEFKPKKQLGVLTGLFGALAVSIFILIGVSFATATADAGVAEASKVTGAKLSGTNTGGRPQLR